MRDDERQHQRDMLAINFTRWLKTEEQVARRAGDPSSDMERDRLVGEINRLATSLGVGSLPRSLVAIAEAAGQRRACGDSLERQQRTTIRRRQALEKQKASASDLNAVDLEMALQEVDRRLEQIEAWRIALVERTTPAADAPPPAPGHTITEAGGGRRAPMLPTHEARLMLQRADAVAQVAIPRVVDGKQRTVPQGSAWLIAPGLAITCWHVVHARDTNAPAAREADLHAQARNCVLTFDFLVPGEGTEYGVAELAHAHRSEDHLDYALLRLTDRGDHPLARRAPLPLDLDAPLTSISDLYIIQHPGGLHQQQSEGSYVTTDERAGRIRYTNHTEGGTSGAPVLNRTNWQVVALHHGSTSDNLNLGEGILLRDILTDLRQQNHALYDEIMDYHTQKGTAL